MIEIYDNYNISFSSKKLLKRQSYKIYYLYKIKIPSGMTWQIVNASPIVGRGQEQIGIWLETVQIAPTPQVPGQGSWHLVLTQACDFRQSVLVKHSGWQPS